MSQEFKITAKRNRLSVRYRYVIFPFVTGDLQNALARTKMDYVLIPPPKTGPTPIGVSLDWNGIIGKKGNVAIQFDSLPQVIGVDGSDLNESINVFLEILDIVKTSIEPTIDENAIFYELLSNYAIETGENPMERLGKIKPEGNLNEKIKNIIQEPVLNYGFHIYSSDKKIQSSDWFDINIQPAARSSEKTFDVMTVYRNKDKSKVEKFVSNHDDYIRKIFDELNKV
ncbi:MAG: hypothetical protein IIA82_08415 [Thaumarchaeota archaeon]|nr:hypothetical protein [Nitrososphaerota archaeon]